MLWVVLWGCRPLTDSRPWLWKDYWLAHILLLFCLIPLLAFLQANVVVVSEQCAFIFVHLSQWGIGLTIVCTDFQHIHLVALLSTVVRTQMLHERVHQASS